MLAFERQFSGLRMDCPRARRNRNMKLGAMVGSLEVDQRDSEPIAPRRYQQVTR
jgi:hypothetical protein